MEKLLAKIKVVVNSKIYNKDPESSDLGMRIVAGSIDMIADLGFDAFTFRKLAKRISSTEASVYRYFDSKHKLLLYLTAWYWAWIEYKMLFSLLNVPSANERLRRAISLLTEAPHPDVNYQHINTERLNRIVIEESAKAFLTKDVDQENLDGVFRDYKSVVCKVAEIINEINPEYKYPHMLVSTVIEGAHLQRFFADHLPMLTDIREDEDATSEFYKDLVFKAIAL